MTVRSIPIKKTMYPNVLRDLLDMRCLLSAQAHFFKTSVRSKGEITTQDGKNTAGRGDTGLRIVFCSEKEIAPTALIAEKAKPERFYCRGVCKGITYQFVCLLEFFSIYGRRYQEKTVFFHNDLFRGKRSEDLRGRLS